MVPASMIQATPARAPAPTRQIAIGEGGSHILGRPNAPVKLVEYGSYTCPHCAHFATEAEDTLINTYVASGRTSFEVRHLVRDPIDLAMAVAVNCGSQARFFIRHKAMFDAQEQILNQVRALPPERLQAWGTYPVNQRIRHVADDSGVTAWMRRMGYTPAQINRCLGDTAMQERLIAMTNAATQAGVTGTPSFAINGSLLPNVYSWAALRPELDSRVALASR